MIHKVQRPQWQPFFDRVSAALGARSVLVTEATELLEEALHRMIVGQILEAPLIAEHLEAHEVDEILGAGAPEGSDRIRPARLLRPR